MGLSLNGARFIAGEEGTRLKRYSNDGGSGGGNCTVGIGHLLHLGPCDGRQGEFDLPNAQAAWDLLIRDIDGSYGPAVERLITVPLNQNQFDALVSFTFNVGVVGLQGSTLRRRLNAGDYGAVCGELRKWVRARAIDVIGLHATGITHDPFEAPFVGTMPFVFPHTKSPSFTVMDSVVVPGLVTRRERECRLFKTPVGPEPSRPRKEPYMGTALVNAHSHMPIDLAGHPDKVEAGWGIGQADAIDCGPDQAVGWHDRQDDDSVAIVLVGQEIDGKPAALDVEAGATAPHTRVVWYRYHGGINQRWLVRGVECGLWIIESKLRNAEGQPMLLEIAQARTDPDAPLVVHAPTEHLCQRWFGVGILARPFD